MRTKLMASVAVALMGMGSVAFASPTPYGAVIDGYNAMTTAVPSSAGDAGTLDAARGAQLAGMVWAAKIGANSGNNAFINTYTQAIVDDNEDNFNGAYSGTEAYGVALAGQAGLNTEATGSVFNFYVLASNGGLTVQGYANTAAHINYVADTGNGGTTDPDTNGIFNLSHHVLASNIVLAATAGQYQAGLLSALGNLNVQDPDPDGAGELNNGSDLNTRNQNGDVSTIQALGAALWALQTVGVNSGTGVTGTGDFAGNTLADLKADLAAALNAKLQHWAAVGTDPSVVSPDFATGYTEDLAYGLLALKAYGDIADASLIATLEDQLANAMLAGGADGIMHNIDNASGVAAQYTGAAIQALPEPATLSLLALGGLGLLARRRRQA